MVRIRAGLAIGPGRADRQIARGINPVQPHHRQSGRKRPQPGSDRADPRQHTPHRLHSEPVVFRSGNPVKLAAVLAGSAFLLGYRLDVGAMQRGCRPEAVEDDADGAAITARANDGPFLAGEIWTSHRAECAHPDAGRRRQPFVRTALQAIATNREPLRSSSIRPAMKNVRCLAGNPPAHDAIDGRLRVGGQRGCQGGQQKHPTIEARLRAAAKSAQRMSAVRACRHICASNMHALDVSSYLATSTIDAVASRWLRDGREKEDHSALELAAAGE